MDYTELVRYYENHDGYYNIFEETKENNSYRYYSPPPHNILQLRELSYNIANSDILSNEELAKDNSLRFSMIIEALNYEKSKRRDTDITKKIFSKYSDTLLELVKDKSLVKNLPEKKKRMIRELKEFYDPANNLNYVSFKNYNNPLSMIAFINGHISSEKRLTQKRAGEVLNKVLIEEERYPRFRDDFIDYSKANSVILYCVNNLMPYLSASSTKKLIKFTLEHIEEPKELFFKSIEKANLIEILFDKKFYIKKFDKFTDQELDLLTNSIKEPNRVKEIMLEKANIIAKRLYLYPNSGGCRVFFSELKLNQNNDNVPYLRDILEVMNNMEYNIQNILLRLGHKSNDY